MDQTVQAKANPYARDLAKAIILLAEEKNSEAAKLMEKWTKES